MGRCPDFKINPVQMRIQKKKILPVRLIVKWMVFGSFIFFILLVLGVDTRVMALDDIDSFRCDKEIVAIGDTNFAVKKKCGDPDKIKTDVAAASKIWIYNFGPHKFIYYLTFVDGRLKRIQIGEHGF